MKKENANIYEAWKDRCKASDGARRLIDLQDHRLPEVSPVRPGGCLRGRARGVWVHLQALLQGPPPPPAGVWISAAQNHNSQHKSLSADSLAYFDPVV